MCWLVRLLARSRSPIADGEAAARLFARSFARLTHEELRVLYIDEQMRPLRMATAGRGIATVELPLRAIVAQALRLDAHAIILAHNHPGGDPNPSRADKIATKRLCDIAHPLKIRVLDHLIFANGVSTSFRELGLL